MRGAIWLRVNGEMRQKDNLADQIWTVPETIAHLSSLFELAPGDLFFTGTPSGVDPVTRGDRFHGDIDGIDEIEITVV